LSGPNTGNQIGLKPPESPDPSGFFVFRLPIQFSYRRQNLFEKKSKIISAHEKQIIAHHEAGSWLLEHVDPLVKVSIVPRGKSLGAAWYLPEERQLKTFPEFFDSLCATLAGRAAEEVIFNEVSSGALDVLEKVTKEAYMMVAY
jgi:AFG3 family protein